MAKITFPNTQVFTRVNMSQIQEIQNIDYPDNTQITEKIQTPSLSESADVETNWNYWYPRVYGYFYKRVDDKIEVEDLTANTMNTVFIAKNIQNIPAYMWRVAHNYLVKYIDTKTTTPTPISFDENWAIAEYRENVEIIVSEKYTTKLTQLMECVKNNINNELDQKLIQLSIIEEQNSTQIAQILDLKPDNVRQKLSRLLKKLRQKCIELWPNSKNNERKTK